MHNFKLRFILHTDVIFNHMFLDALKFMTESKMNEK